MKYTILGFSQDKLIELGLDLTDAAILRELHDFKATGRMVERDVGGEKMFWVKYPALIEALPVLGLKTKDSVYRRMMKMVKSGVLKHKTLKENGTYSFFAFTPLSDEMQYRSDEKSEGYGSDVGGGTDEKSEQKTLLTENTNLTKDSTEATASPPSDCCDKKPNATEQTHTQEQLRDDRQKIIDLYNRLPFPRMVKLTPSRKKHLDARIKEWGVDEIARCFTMAAHSPFLTGKNNREWVANIDFLLNPNNFVKVMEGKYDEKKKMESV